MKLTLIANIKSYKIASDIQKWLALVDQHALQTRPPLNLLVALPFPYFHLARSFSRLQLAAQNVSPFPPGSYTGEVNANQLQDQGVHYCLVGHSERRKYFHETNQTVVNKVELLLDHNITPIICLDDNNFRSQLSLLDSRLYSHCLFAYEPISSIGTGNPADPDQVQETAHLISKLTKSPVLYGGSIDSLNASTYTNLPAINGLLVGNHSLDPQSFISIIQAVS